jgi:hypothetical protein
MDKSGPPKRLRHLSSLPSDLFYIIFSKLECIDKINAGMVCKQWDQLLRSGTPSSTHWVVNYNVGNLVSNLQYLTTPEEPTVDQLTIDFGRYVTVATLLHIKKWALWTMYCKMAHICLQSSKWECTMSKFSAYFWHEVSPTIPVITN